MDCACVYVDTSESGPTLFEEKIVTARKPHKCGECRRSIEMGEEYEHTKGLWEGRFETHKTCSECRAIRSAFFCNGWFYGQVIHDLREHISDAGGDISESCIAELPPRARAKVCKMIEAYWGEQEEYA
jgi:hypothetical protein